MHNFNIKILRAQLLRALENKLVFTGLANNSFSGEINQKNDVVKLLQIGDIDINDYTDGTDTTQQTLTDAALEIIADQDKYFDFALDTLEFNNNKSAILAEAMRKAAYAMNNTIDAQFAALYASSGITQNTNASPVDMTSLNVEDELLNFAEAFAEAGIPRDTRKALIVPPWVSNKIVLAGIATKTQNDAAFASGYIGTALGWDIVESNNVSKNSSSWDKTRIMGVVPGQSLGYAAAVSTMETKRIEKQIGKTKMQGRLVYGYKVVRPDMTGVLYADKTAEA